MKAKEREINARKFTNKIYKCLALLGERSDLLSTVGSWRDSLPDEDVLEALDSWIEDQKTNRIYITIIIVKLTKALVNF